ncbi:hypothetical protein [Spirosoma sp.]|uniref:hypothetical protein n=1 Tax=Spirosoma sp. TaxID=1899569 RepID=UPI0026192642|nr:hypothetical protein [Spirosoma sp.]MCX6213255.1 hypothetical protein [Spirosoma sp.]
MSNISTLLVVIFLGIVITLILVPTFYLLRRLINTAKNDDEPLEGRDYFYLIVNAMFPFVLIGAEWILKWATNSRELGTFWIVGTISAAMGLLLGNLKPKELPTNQETAKYVDNLGFEYGRFHKRDHNIIRWCWLLLFVEFVIWTLANVATAKGELFDFWTNLILTIAVYGLSLYMSYRKELV